MRPQDLSAALAGRYEIEKELGRGGMASVWLAKDLRHDRMVAIKVLHPDLAGALGVDRFLREIRITGRLRHPGIIPMLDSGVLAGSDGVMLPWYAMPFVAGESLRNRLSREGHLPIDEALQITREAAAALQSAHLEGVVHRDIKPENLMLAGGHTFVADFGLARAVMDADSSRLTRSGMAIGTPQYMSPEQGAAEPVDARTDQYALASVLYEMLTGEPPFTGFNAQAIMARRLVEPARPIRSVRASVPEGLEAAVLKALERTPADRFPDVEAFAAALGRPHAKSPSRRLVRGLGLVAAILLVAAGVWFGGRQQRRAEGPDSVAVALFRRGVQGYDTRTPAGVIDGIQSLRGAIARDSTYAAAWAALARAYVRSYERSFAVPGISRDSLPPVALIAANRALALDSTQADAWLTRGIMSRAIDPTDAAPVARSFHRAIGLDSTVPLAWHYLALVLAEAGNIDEALSGWRRTVALDPTYTQGLAFLALGHYWIRQYDSAARWVDSALAVDPDFLLSRTTAGYIAIERGEYLRAKNMFDAARRMSTDVELVTALAGLALTDARAGLRREAQGTMVRAESLAVHYDPPTIHMAVNLAAVYAALGESDRATAWLRRYAPPGDLHFQLHLRCDPPLDPLRRDPRFQSLLIQTQDSSSCSVNHSP